MGYRNLQEKSNQFWTMYSKMFIRFSWLILLLSLVVTISLSICFLYLMQIRTFDQTYFLVRNGRARKNIQQINNLFGNDKRFRVHQQMDLYPALDIIIRKKTTNINDTNMLDNQIIDEIHLLDHRIQSFRINNSANTVQYNYSSLCVLIDRACAIDGNYLLSKRFRQNILNLEYIPSGMYFDSLTGANGLDEFIFSKHYTRKNLTISELDYVDPDEDDDNDEEITHSNIKQIISYVPIFRLRYELDISNEQSRRLALQWEQEISRYLNENYQSTLLNLSISISTSIADTITKQAHTEGPYLAIMLIVFFIIVCFFISIQGNFHTSVGYLSLCGIVNIILSSGATFGLLTLFRVEIIEPMSFLVLGIAIVDCMRTSIVCGEYHRIIQQYLPHSSTERTLTKVDIEKLVHLIIKSTRSCFLPSILIISFVYLFISILSPMLATKYLGFILLLYVFINYLTHSLFFTSCLIITLKRILSNRHCLFCYHLPNDYYMKIRTKSLKTTFKHKRKEFWKKFHPILKILLTSCVCCLSILFVIVNIWLILEIDTRLFDEKFLPKNATSIRSYMKSQVDDYNIGPIIMFVIPQSIDYQNLKNQNSIRRLLSQCMNESTTNNFKLLWLDHEDINLITTGKDPLPFRITPYSLNDIVLTDGKNNKSIIRASRFYCQFKSFTGSRKESQIMNKLYKYAEESTIPSVFPYSIVFMHYESLERVRTEMNLLILFMVILTIVIIFLSFFSLKKTSIIVLHLFIVLSGNLACLYVFHNLSFNFANALWLFVLPIIYLDAIIHASLNIKKSKWKYNRVILSILMALVVFSFFSIETYIFLIIRNSLFYQAIICFLVINVSLPSWNYMMKICLKKKKKERKLVPTMDTNQTVTTNTEIQNLVHEPNGHMNGSI